MVGSVWAVQHEPLRKAQPALMSLLLRQSDLSKSAPYLAGMPSAPFLPYLLTHNVHNNEGSFLRRLSGERDGGTNEHNSSPRSHWRCSSSHSRPGPRNRSSLLQWLSYCHLCELDRPPILYVAFFILVMTLKGFEADCSPSCVPSSIPGFASELHSWRADVQYH